MNNKVGILIFSFLFSTIQLMKAQEVFLPLSSNPVIKEFLKKNPPENNSVNRTSSLVTLPFIDDFSGNGIYPDINLWEDSDVFINSTFCDNPPTLGCATFDGINKYGNPYDSTSGVSVICDYLTSQPIDINVAPTDTSVWLSFYYQPQGLGLAPFTNDSLVLQFLDSSDTWVSVWNHIGTSKVPFARVNIHVLTAKYLYSGFQFRFLNYASPNANRDHWNVDYVKLDKNRVNNDDLVDIGFINKPTSLLNGLQQMPWTHYKNYSSPSSLMKTSIVDSVRNLGYSLTTLNYFAHVYDAGGTNLYTSPANPQNSSPNSATTFTSALTSGFAFPSTPEDSATFFIKNYCTSTGPTYPWNDTATYTQNFANCYAYDDGSAESNYGITGIYSEWAYRFDVKMRDTLRGVQIYFNPSGYPVHQQLISICYWSNVDPSNNSDVLVYKMIDRKPYNVDSINGFATYLFDTPLIAEGTIYVGLIQNYNVLLGVGVDKNTDANGKMFFKSTDGTNTWTTSSLHGSWMIRPLFGKLVQLVGVDEIVSDNSSISIYPNPNNSQFTIHNSQSNIRSIEILNMVGEKVYSDENLNCASCIVNCALPSGIYFVRMKDEKGFFSKAKKLVVYR